MEQEIKVLLDRFYEGQTTLEEEKKLQLFFAAGPLSEEMAFEKAYFSQILQARKESLSTKVAAASVAQLETTTPQTRRLYWPLQVAASVIMLIAGYWMGRQNGIPHSAAGEAYVAPRAGNLLSLDYQNSSSASDRILVLNQLSDSGPDDDLTLQQVINTLHFDPNVNVRMAALNTLQHVAKKRVAADALIRALSIEKDPIIQVSLIETISRLKDKRAVESLRKLSEDSNNLKLVREMARQAASVIDAGQLFV